jgi:hypothetical protein
MYHGTLTLQEATLRVSIIVDNSSETLLIGSDVLENIEGSLSFPNGEFTAKNTTKKAHYPAHFYSTLCGQSGPRPVRENEVIDNTRIPVKRQDEPGVRKLIKDLLDKGAIERIPQPDKFCSVGFAVKKHDGSFCLVVNLAQVRNCIPNNNAYIGSDANKPSHGKSYYLLKNGPGRIFLPDSHHRGVKEIHRFPHL